MTPETIASLLSLAVGSIVSGRKVFAEVKSIIRDMRAAGSITAEQQEKLFDEVNDAEAAAEDGRYPAHWQEQ